MYDVAVVGFGAAGCKIAMDAIFSNAMTAIFTGGKQSKKRSRSIWVRHGNENVPGLNNISTPEIIKSTRKHIETGRWAHNATFFDEDVVNIQSEANCFRLTAANDQEVVSKFVVLALGATDIQPQIPAWSGNIKPLFPYANGTKTNRPTIHYCLRCDGHLVHGNDFAVIGHTLGATHVAKALLVRSVVVNGGIITFRPKSYLLLHGEKPLFSEDQAMALDGMGIEIISESIIEILGEPKEAKLGGFLLSNDKVINVPVAFVSLGMLSNQSDLAGPLKNMGVAFNDDNQILVNENNETSVPGIFSIGDGVAGRLRQIYCHWADSPKIMKVIGSYLTRKILQFV